MLKNLLLLAAACFSASMEAAALPVAAAENFYGNLAAEIGGPYVQVVSLLNNPRQDPHLMSASPAAAKAVADASVIIYNGLDYDPWMKNLIAPAANKKRMIIIVGDLMGKTMGDNPHIWYDPKTMLALANTLASSFSQLDTAHQAYYYEQLEIFKKEYEPLMKKIAEIKKQYHGERVIATEPVFNEMAAALGLEMQGQKFQISVMNGTSPAAADIKDFEDQLKNRSVKILIYNNQVSSPITEQLKILAKKAGIPVVGVSETEPADQNYFTWMQNQLNTLEKALVNSSL